ncbi:tumor necrosis factor ligand superfamily member 11-like [Clupea harengus]|uniref:Tumor necrosis factor ligand superfamily member 11-like n=1 Tax=Clupea harengus TaxID=7950 RepID=A0A6P8ESH8_CLUHA|nr:tumor necrosis factor ligand superfamily member 11-like [Clupea harengus]
MFGPLQVHGAERGPAVGETLIEPQQKHQSRARVHRRQRNRTPVAHLPIRPPSTNGQREVHATIVHWNADQGHLSQLGYHDGRILFQKPGLYYIYSKTCFRYYQYFGEPELSRESSNLGHHMLPTLSPVQLMQYIFLERPNRGSPPRPTTVMKTGSTHQWSPSGYHMSCQQQGGAVALRAGDGLYVSVSNAWMLDPEAEGSYFGTFRIGE